MELFILEFLGFTLEIAYTEKGWVPGIKAGKMPGFVPIKMLPLSTFREAAGVALATALEISVQHSFVVTFCELRSEGTISEQEYLMLRKSFDSNISEFV